MLHCNSYATWIWEHTQQKDHEMMVGYLKQLTNSFVCNLNCRNMNNYDRHTPITIFTRHLYLDIIVHNTCISQKSLHVTMSFTCYYMFINHNTLGERERDRERGKEREWEKKWERERERYLHI